MKAVCMFITMALSLPLTAQSIVGTWTVFAAEGNGQERVATIIFEPNSSYKVDTDVDGTYDITGTYTLQDGNLTMKDTSGANSCPDAGTYKYRITENKMQMELVDDPCRGRHSMASFIFQRQ